MKGILGKRKWAKKESHPSTPQTKPKSAVEIWHLLLHHHLEFSACEKNLTPLLVDFIILSSLSCFLFPCNYSSILQNFRHPR